MTFPVRMLLRRLMHVTLDVKPGSAVVVSGPERVESEADRDYQFR